MYLVGFRHIKPRAGRCLRQGLPPAFPAVPKKLPYERTGARTPHLCRWPELSPAGLCGDIPLPAQVTSGRCQLPGEAGWAVGRGMARAGTANVPSGRVPCRGAPGRTVPAAACSEQMSNQNSHCRLWCQDGNRDGKHITKPFIC